MYKLSDRGFFSQDALALAKALLGKLIVHETDGQRLALRITETEAYLGVDDLASHSAGGHLTRRNRIMFGKPGHVYMFLIYGRYFCFNITANDEGRPEAVLIRAGEPVLGAPVMLKNRGLTHKGGSAAAKERAIADGPGKLCMALGLNMEHYGLDLTDDGPIRLFIAQDDFKPKQSEIISDVRIGIDYAGAYRDRPWRFYLKDRTVSLTKEKRLQRQKKMFKILRMNYKGVTQMDDNLLLMMEGRWHLQYSGCPIWLKDEINTVTFHYGAIHLGEELVLEDRVEYIRNGKMRFRLGFDYPLDGIPRTFKWKGKGVNRTFRNHFEVTILKDDFMVLFFEKTITSPTGIDILTRARIISDAQKEVIFQAVRENPTVRDYLGAVRKVT